MAGSGLRNNHPTFIAKPDIKDDFWNLDCTDELSLQENVGHIALGSERRRIMLEKLFHV